MEKRTYITPKATPINLDLTLLYAISGENQEWGAKESELDFDMEEEEMKQKQTFIINW